MRGDFEATNEDLYAEFGERWAEDTWGQDLLHLSLYDMDLATDLRAAAYIGFETHMREEYEIEFDDWFDWDDYRDWYDSQ